MKTKILVVDDEIDLEALIRQRFRRKIRDEADGYEFVFAHDGEDALRQVAQHPDTAIVLSDINMPVMDGLVLLGRMHLEHPAIRTVMVSAYGDLANIRTAMNRGAFDFVTKPIDFADLELTIEKTLAQVRLAHQQQQDQRENDILKMYVDGGVIDFMTHADAAGGDLLRGQTIEATVLFVDVCGFTALSERLPPAVVVALLNAYFDQMVRAIVAEGGLVDKFIGDAVMAVFQGDGHLRRALRAACAIRRNLAAHPVPLPAGLAEAPAVSMGVNPGEMVSGNIGSASLKRLDYTVIGDAVNLAQRLQAAAAPGQIVVSAATFEQVQHEFSGAFVGEVKLKNKALPQRIFQVLD